MCKPPATQQPVPADAQSLRLINPNITVVSNIIIGDAAQSRLYLASHMQIAGDCAAYHPSSANVHYQSCIQCSQHHRDGCYCIVQACIWLQVTCNCAAYQASAVWTACLIGAIMHHAQSASEDCFVR